MPDTEPVRGIAEAHRRVDAVMERVIVVETQQKEVLRRLESIEEVPKLLTEMAAQIASLTAKVQQQQWLLGLVVGGLITIAWQLLAKR